MLMRHCRSEGEARKAAVTGREEIKLHNTHRGGESARVGGGCACLGDALCCVCEKSRK